MAVDAPDATVRDCAAMPAMTPTDLSTFLARAFPQGGTELFQIETLGDGFVRFSYDAGENDLRPGNTVSGPTLMMLSDTGMYMAVLAMIGPVALAVTTNLNINFLRKAHAGKLTVEVTILKLGKRLAVGEVFVHSEHAKGPVSHATVTYSIPPHGG